MIIFYKTRCGTGVAGSAQLVFYKILRNSSDWKTDVSTGHGRQFLKRSHSGDDPIVTLGDKPKEKIFVCQ